MVIPPLRPRVIPHGRHSPAQAYLYHKIQSVSRQRSDRILRQARLSAAQTAELALARQKLDLARIVVNLNLHERIAGRPIIDSLVDTGRIYNLFEIAQAAIGYNPSVLRLRIMLEFKLYGATSDLQDVLAGMSNVEHPNYGLFDYLAQPVGYSLVGFYGWYRFVLKSEVKRRSTFSPMDTKYTNADQTLVWNGIDGILATKIGGRYWFEYVNDGTIPLSVQGNVSYIESQILGGVWMDNDVEALYYPQTDELNKPFFRKLEQLESMYNVQLISY